MEFSENKSIFMQVADYVCDKILGGAWGAEERIPSVRELGVELQINPNTAVRSFDFLQKENIIYMKRGMGYYVMEEAIENIKRLRRKDFFENQLPLFIKTMNTLGIGFEEVRSYLVTSNE